MKWRVKKECYRLTWPVRLIITLAFILGLFFLIKNLYGFLSPQKEVASKILVVEGWISDYALQESLDIFYADSYDYIITTGGPLTTGYVLMGYESTAEIAKATLLKMGGPTDKIIAVNRDLVWRERTFSTAMELRHFLKNEMPTIKSINLISMGAHSRRSWLLFKKALPEMQVGIITIDDRLFDTKHWWNSSKGFRTVLTESLGYFYVLLFFHPDVH